VQARLGITGKSRQRPMRQRGRRFSRVEHAISGGACDGSNSGRQRTTRTGEVPLASTQGGNRDAPANTPGIRHIAFAVDDIDAAVASVRAQGGELVGEVENYEDIYPLCYVRGPEGIIIELAEQIA
jgi:catechol 2,3-dioxygenase-like lactoylglutathione lyase family enzyme